MEYTKTNSGVKVKNISNLDLAHTFDCGQCFRWTESNNTFRGVAFGKVVDMRIVGKDLYIDNTTVEDFENIWIDYLDLNLDYGKINKEISSIHPVLSDAAKYAQGIRILQQDSWEALCSFIISQNNNIKRIKGIITRLCEKFGDEIEENSFSFPSAEVIASLTVEDLQDLRAGFRSKYIIDAAEKVASGQVNLSLCNKMDYQQARQYLQQIKGVGVKVADCTLLFGFHRIEAFPVDVWMKRAMEKLFPNMTAEDFGRYAGIAQQYIFHYSRSNPQLFE